MLYAAEGQHAQIIIVMCLRKTPHYVTSQSCKKKRAARAAVVLFIQPIAGLHVTSRRPCWGSWTKAFLSSGN